MKLNGVLKQTLLNENENFEKFQEDEKDFLEELFDDNELEEGLAILDEMDIDYQPFSIGDSKIIYLEDYNIIVSINVFPEVYKGEDEIIQFVEELDQATLEEFFNYDPKQESEIFWRNINSSKDVVWHNTSEENCELIQQTGYLKSSKETRGSLNRFTQSAIFVTTSPDEAQMGVYGDVILEIDLYSMKQDGYTPFVSKEEPCVEFMLKNKLINLINPHIPYDDTYISMDGIDCENTLVIYGDIPIKYITREE